MTIKQFKQQIADIPEKYDNFPAVYASYPGGGQFYEVDSTPTLILLNSDLEYSDDDEYEPNSMIIN